MKDFAGKIAVVTGGGSGMGRALVRALAGEGASVAFCDISALEMEETARLARGEATQGARISAHRADVANEDDLLRFRDEMMREHQTGHIHLLFNNAGIGGGASFIRDKRETWERTFNICWGGVYLTSRVFVPLMLKATEGHIVNTSSLCGFWASLGPGSPHTAYSTAKFAVKGFTESLIEDLRVNAPHIKCSVVMPGHVGTSINSNTRRILQGRDTDELSRGELDGIRNRLLRHGRRAEELTDEKLQARLDEQIRRFREDAPITAEQAAQIMLDAVRQERWRVLLGEDSRRLDERVRADPEGAYDHDLLEGWRP